MSVPQNQFILSIDAFKPETFPMERLAAYLREFAKILGYAEGVHFEQLRGGSSAIVAFAEEVSVPKIERRLFLLRSNSGPQELRIGAKNMDDLLAEDNGTGSLSHNGAIIIEFPGRNRPKPVILKKVRQRDSLDGELVQIGGRDDTVPVHIYDARRDRVFKCNTSKTRAKELAPHLFGVPIRVFGDAEWERDETGAWTMRDLWITEFFELSQQSVQETIERLRAIPGNNWHLAEDPLAELLNIRYGTEG